jgi:protein SCO1
MPAFAIYLLMLRSAPPPPRVSASLEGLVDQHGEVLGPKAFRNRYKLLAFGYTQCPEACPTALMKMRVILSALGAAASNVVPLFVTVDPEHDAAEVLGRYTAGFDPRIVAIAGDKRRLERYARAFGVLPPADAATHRTGTAAHAVRLFLLAPDDSVVATYELTDPTPLVVADVERRMADGRATVGSLASPPRMDVTG